MPAIKHGLKRKARAGHSFLLKGMKKHCSSFFLDSGAHTLYTLHVINVGHANGYKFYKSNEFKKYVHDYANLIQNHKDGMDFYANVDVIFNPQMSWEILKRLEGDYGLHPVPVIHYGTDLKWIDKHLKAGYTFLGIGGLGQEATRTAYKLWADRLFERLCPGPSFHPIVRTHGFAMTSHELMLRYPWYSVDSASWAKLAGFGSIYVPHRRNGEWTFSIIPYIIAFSHRSSFFKTDGRTFVSLKKSEKRIVLDWLDEIEVPYGKMRDGLSEVWGVSSDYNARAVANLRFFQKFQEWLPKYPWPFKIKPRTGFLPWGDFK